MKKHLEMARARIPSAGVDKRQCYSLIEPPKDYEVIRLGVFARLLIWLRGVFARAAQVNHRVNGRKNHEAQITDHTRESRSNCVL